MKDKTQVFTGTTYKVLDTMAEMNGRQVIKVVELSQEATAFVNNGTILILECQAGAINTVAKNDLLPEELAVLEDVTGITKDQLI